MTKQEKQNMTVSLGLLVFVLICISIVYCVRTAKVEKHDFSNYSTRRDDVVTVEKVTTEKVSYPRSYIIIGSNSASFYTDYTDDITNKVLNYK